MNICSHSDCKNNNKDVTRWTLTDSRGYGCGTVCSYCENMQKGKFKPVIFKDPQEYLKEMVECGENVDGF